MIGVNAAEFIAEKDPFSAIALGQSLVTTLRSSSLWWFFYFLFFNLIIYVIEVFSLISNLDGIESFASFVRASLGVV